MQEKNKIGECFVASASFYDQYALVQKEVAKRLAQLISPQLRADRVLEIGCGTGVFTESLTQRLAVKNLYLNDLASHLCDCAAKRAAAQHVCKLVGDGESIELPGNLDLIVSSSSLQWFEDLESYFPHLHSKLNATGQLALAFYGTGTMHELASISGQGLDYLSHSRLKDILSHSFSSFTLERYQEILYFPSFFSILKHVRNTGVGAVLTAGKKKVQLAELEALYRKGYGTKKGLPLTYNCYLLTAQK